MKNVIKQIANIISPNPAIDNLAKNICLFSQRANTWQKIASNDIATKLMLASEVIEIDKQITKIASSIKDSRIRGELIFHISQTLWDRAKNYFSDIGQGIQQGQPVTGWLEGFQENAARTQMYNVVNTFMRETMKNYYDELIELAEFNKEHKNNKQDPPKPLDEPKYNEIINAIRQMQSELTTFFTATNNIPSHPNYLLSQYLNKAIEKKFAKFNYEEIKNEPSLVADMLQEIVNSMRAVEDPAAEAHQKAVQQWMSNRTEKNYGESRPNVGQDRINRVIEKYKSNPQVISALEELLGQKLT
jgi:hypothetical protein